jgi:predicted dehydrogenase
MADPGSTERIRIGVVGCGFVARAVHLPRLAGLERHFELAGVADPDGPARRAIAERHRTRGFADHHDLLATAEPDAVLVCSPDATHADVVLDALGAGAHVLVEKPLCTSPEDADRIAAAANEAGRVVQVGYMKRFDPAFEALAADLAAAREPLVHVATLTYDPGLGAVFGAPAAPPQPDLAGALNGALVHDVNAVHGLLDAAGIDTEARVADGFGRADGSLAGGTVAFEDGLRWTLAWLHLPGLGDFRERIELFGRAGIRSLEFPAPYLRRSPATYAWSRPGRGGNATGTLRAWEDAYERQLRHFHACITEGETCRTPPEQARRDLALLRALHDAARAAQAVPA